MTEGIISIGNKIDIYKASEKDDSSAHKVYVSQLLDLLEGNKANIAIPIENGHVVPLSVGIRYVLCFYTAKGMFQCKALVTERFVTDNIYIATVQFLTDFEKFQRRQFYRLACALNIKYHVVTDEEQRLGDRIDKKRYSTLRERDIMLLQLDELESDTKPAIASNISGGGIRFGSQEKIEKDSKLILSFILDDEGKVTNMRIKGRVVASEKVVNKNVVYENRIEFIDLDNVTREFIVKYIFNEERRQRRKAKGLY